eukprot:4290525-Pleurochrysis_carterae.AAC.1
MLNSAEFQTDASETENAHTWKTAMPPDNDNTANATAEGGRQTTAHAQTPRVREHATPLRG